MIDLNNYMSEIDLSKKYCVKCSVEMINDGSISQKDWDKIILCSECANVLKYEDEWEAEIQMAIGDAEAQMMEEENDN